MTQTPEDFETKLPKAGGPKALRACAEAALGNSLASLNRTRLDARLNEFLQYKDTDQEYCLQLRKEADRKLSRFLNHATSRARAFSFACGLFGWVGQVADLPLFYIQVFKNVAEVALLYGYDPREKQEQRYILGVVEIGHIPISTYRHKEVERLLKRARTRERDLVLTTAVGLGGRFLTQMTRKILPRRLRLAAPILGAVLNGEHSARLTENIVKTAQLFYRQRLASEEQS